MGLLKSILFVGVLGSFSGCATKKINEAELNKVKTVAIVAFTSTLPVSQTLSLDAGSGKTSGAAGGSLIPGSSKESEEILTSLVLALQKNKRWQVTELAALKKNPAYIQAYKATMEGWQNKMPPGEGQTNYQVEGIMDKDGVRLLGPEGKNQLIKALGVDAVVVVNVHTTLEGFKVMGIGKRKPQSTANIQVYSINEEGPIWFESFKGEQSDESVGMTGFIDETKLQKLAVTSSQSAFSKIK